VLFDIDGTLLHTNAVGLTAFGRALELEFAIEHGTRGVKFAGRTDTGIAREILRRHGIEPSKTNLANLFDCYLHLLADLLIEGRGEICSGVGEFIRELRHLPEPPVIGLLTGNLRLGAELKLRRFGLWDFFTTGAFADDHEDRNQIATVAHQRGCQLLGRKLRGEQMLVIGDTPLDIACGRAIGARVLAVATGGSPLAELEAHQPDWAAENLTRVSARVACAG
jgi:phosphoglycolate phosphatase-like HAD superfamily hydrolase